MVKLIEINGDDEFVFDTIVYMYGKDGKKHLIANYKKCYGDSLIITLEGEATTDNIVASEKIEYRNFRRRFLNHRIYIQGHVSVGE